MVIKEFDIVLDLKRTKQLNVIEVVQGDYETNIFNIQIEDNYVPVDLTGTTIDVMFAKADGTTVLQDNAEIIDAASGKIRLVLSTNTIAANGKVLAEVRIKESGKIVTTAQFSFTVRRAIVSNVVSSNEYPILEKIIKDATEAQDKYEEMVKRSFVILKPPVATAADIPTTYPNPENGWTTRAQDTGNMYRYNRYTDSWELIDNIPSTAYDALLNEFRPAIEQLQTDLNEHLLESAQKHITESGSNANGYYVKFDDGLMICRHAIANIDIAGTSGQLFMSAPVTWTLPATFKDTYSVEFAGIGSSNTFPGHEGHSVSTFTFRLNAAVSRTAQIAYLIAIGRWK